MSINESITELNQTKQLIKQAIIDKGVEVSDSDSFRTYEERIRQIHCKFYMLTLIFKYNGEELSHLKRFYEYGDIVNLDSITPPDGYEIESFDDGKTSGGGGTTGREEEKPPRGEERPPAQEINLLSAISNTITITEDITIYAILKEENGYIITLDPNGGTLADGISQMKTGSDGKLKEMPKDPIPKDARGFEYWYFEKPNFDISDPNPIKEKVTLNTVFTANTTIKAKYMDAVPET